MSKSNPTGDFSSMSIKMIFKPVHQSSPVIVGYRYRVEGLDIGCFAVYERCKGFDDASGLAIWQKPILPMNKLVISTCNPVQQMALKNSSSRSWQILDICKSTLDQSFYTRLFAWRKRCHQWLWMYVYLPLNAMLTSLLCQTLSVFPSVKKSLLRKSL